MTVDGAFALVVVLRKDSIATLDTGRSLSSTHVDIAKIRVVSWVRIDTVGVIRLFAVAIVIVSLAILSPATHGWVQQEVSSVRWMRNLSIQCSSCFTSRHTSVVFASVKVGNRLVHFIRFSKGQFTWPFEWILLSTSALNLANLRAWSSSEIIFNTPERRSRGLATGVVVRTTVVVFFHLHTVVFHDVRERKAVVVHEAFFGFLAGCVDKRFQVIVGDFSWKEEQVSQLILCGDADTAGSAIDPSLHGLDEKAVAAFAALYI